MREEDENCEQNADDNNFDLIIVGTSFIESIVACAAARNGKKVLHIDHRDHYGGSYASFNISGLIREYSLNSEAGASNVPSSQHGFVARPVSEMVIRGNDPSSNLKTFLSYNYSSKKFFHPSMNGIVTGNFTPYTVPQADSSHVHPAFFGLLTAEKQQAAHLLTKDREFCIDTATKTVPGTGAFIDTLIASGVSRYLEFKTNDAMFFLISEEHVNSSSIFGNKSIESSAVSPLLWRVPCSKNDIFNSKQLSALEKRALMKFHQFVNDWGRTSAGADVTVLNENQLAIGRSLYRPQNKASDTSATAANASSISKETLQTQSFSSFLKSYHLSDKLQNLIMYGLCLLPSSTETPVTATKPLSAQQGLQELSLHLNSLGKYGENANLVPIYGLGEIVQGFCRMSAVWAGVYMLRYELSSLTVAEQSVTTEKKVSLDHTSTAEENNTDNTVASEVIPTKTLEVERTTVVSIQGISEVERYESAENPSSLQAGPIYTAPRALVHFSYAPQQTFCAPVFSLQMIFVYQGRIFPAERCLTVIPPRYVYKHHAESDAVHLQNDFAVHILQVDESASTVPEGATVLQAHTYISALMGESRDDNASFLYADWITQAEKVREQAQLLSQEIQRLVETLSTPAENTLKYSEICSRVLLRPVFQGSSNENPDSNNSAPILFCGDVGGFSLHLEDEVHAAEGLYKQLFGADAVMFNPEGPDPQEEMQLCDEDDDEVAHLYKYATSAMEGTAATDSASATTAASIREDTSQGLTEGSAPSESIDSPADES